MKTTGKQIRVADYIMQFLKERGLEKMFLLTGNGAMYLNDAVAVAGIRYYCARNEAAAPMMAESLARLTGKLGVVCVTAGPGATNALPGLAEAFVDSAPIMMISGQSPSDELPASEGARGVRTFGSAGVDVVPAVRPFTKYAVTVIDPATIRFHLEKAYYLATSGRPGPVWLDLPMDVQYAPIDPASLKGFDAPADPPSGIIDRAVDAVIDVLMKAKKPLLVGGHGVRQSGAIAEFRALVERLQSPFMLTRLGNDMIPHSHPLNLGQGGVKGEKYSPEVMRGADAIIAFGSRLAVQFAGPKYTAFAPDATVVMIDIDPAELEHNKSRVNLPIKADVGKLLPRLLERLKTAKLPDWSAWGSECRRAKAAKPMILPEQHRDPIDLYYFMSRLDALSEARHIFVTDAGSNYYVGGQVYHFEKGQREVTSASFAAMGLSIPLAIGAAVACPDMQILAVTGDGSLELNIQELKTISYYRFDIKLFVINNGGYVSMRTWQDTYFEGRRIGSDDTTGAEMLDLKRVADAFEIPYALIAKADDIDDQIRRIIQNKGPLFVEVVCDNNQKICLPFNITTATAS